MQSARDSQRAWRRAIAIGLAIASPVLAGCGAAAQENAAEPVPEGETVEASGDLAGTLHAIPEVLRAGDTVRVAIENAGTRTLHFGISNRVERFAAGRWERALPLQPVPDVGLRVLPGKREGPWYGPHVVDQVRLPADLEPGTYRVLKDVGPTLRRVGALTLTATFEVRSANDVRQIPADLEGRKFTSTAVTENGEPPALVRNTEIEVRFERRRDHRVVAWEAACNSYGSRVEIIADRLLLRAIMGTAMGCHPALEDQDDWLADFFDYDPHWRLSGDRLTLTSAETVIELEASRG